MTRDELAALDAVEREAQAAGKIGTSADARRRLKASLLSLYRTGKLVMVPSVEEISADLTSAFCENVDDWLEDRIDDCDMGAILSRAVLTSMGAKTVG